MQLRILYATQGGNARSVAQAIALALEDAAPGGIAVQDMQDAPLSLLAEPAPATLFCISTYGAGDMPDSGAALYDALATHPLYLGHLRYGMVALGDSSHGDTFCGGGLRFDERLQDLGARRIGDLLRIDALEEPVPEEAAARWAPGWWEALSTVV